MTCTPCNFLVLCDKNRIDILDNIVNA